MTHDEIKAKAQRADNMFKARDWDGLAVMGITSVSRDLGDPKSIYEIFLDQTAYENGLFVAKTVTGEHLLFPR